MIQFKAIDKAILARLDAEGTDAFDLTLDRLPAVNGAQHLVMSAVSSMFESNKRVVEALRDLRSDEVFQTNAYGHLALDHLVQSIVGRKLWTIIGVHPEFEMANRAFVLAASPGVSMLRHNLRFLYPKKSAKHYTNEEWGMALDDVFAEGSMKYTGSEKSYGYTDVFPDTTQTSSPGPHIAILPPPSAAMLVAVSYLRVPEDVPDQVASDQEFYESYQLQWPSSMQELLIAVALRVITQKQGDGTTVNSLNQQETAMLLQAIA